MKKIRERGKHDWGLFHHRWGIPVLATLVDMGGGAKFITLQRRLEVSRDSLKRTLEALLRLGLVRRNPGYGHPMRPEYVLTSRGKKIAHVCAEIVGRLDATGAREIGLNKWSLPVIYALSVSDGRFGSIQAMLGGISPRALAQALRDLEETGLVVRSIVDGYPPRAEYGLAEPGRLIATLVESLLL